MKKIIVSIPYSTYPSKTRGTKPSGFGAASFSPVLSFYYCFFINSAIFSGSSWVYSSAVMFSCSFGSMVQKYL